MITAAIFDMDGLLVDSEPLWTKAEIEIFGSLGIALTAADCAQTVGLGLDQVVELRHRQKPWHGPSCAEVSRRILERVIERIGREGAAMPGALEALKFFRRQGCLLALASSSDEALIRAVLRRLDLERAFDWVQSAATLSYPKPHPEVYLACAERLRLDPHRCLAVEDSLPGLIAAKAAGMRALAVPDPRLRSDPRYTIADVVLPSLTELDLSVWQRLNPPV